MSKKVRRIIISLTAIVMFVALAFAANAGSAVYNWYTKRTGSSQPPTIPSDLRVVEKYNVSWVDDSIAQDCGNKVLYLTFDFGYENGNTEKILDILDSKNVKASFFVLAHPIKENTALVQRMFENGHAVCNHTQSHTNMSKVLSKEEFYKELVGLEELCKTKTGYDLKKFYRPPEGAFSEDNLRFATEMGYKTVFWSLAYADWDNNKQPNDQKAKELLLNNTHNGAVILLHPTSSTNVAILGDLIDAWRSDGYEFKTVEALP